jgi:hypothetical protein
MRAIQSLMLQYAAKVFQWGRIIKAGGVSPMKSNYPFSPPNNEKEDQLKAPAPSRFIDEKISDETDTESNTDSALRPAGLSNPFWN